jgi:hypothetical protein
MLEKDMSPVTVVLGDGYVYRLTWEPTKYFNWQIERMSKSGSGFVNVVHTLADALREVEADTRRRYSGWSNV